MENTPLMQKTVSILSPNLGVGGAERVALNIANELVSRGYAVDMVLMSAVGPLVCDLRSEVRVVDLKVARARYLLFPLVRYLRRSRPEVLLAQMWPTTAVAVWACKLSRVATRIVLAEHTTWSSARVVKSASVRWRARLTMHLSFGLADAVVAVSQGAADDLASFAALDRRAITVIYNPVVGAPRAASLTPMAPDAWWSGAHRRLLAVGTLKPVKDYPTLLKAFALLRQRTNAKLLILGEGMCRQELEAQAVQLGIASDVFLPGETRDPSPFYQRADLHVLSSTGEGLSMVIIEALAAGTPVVSTDCPSGPREILQGGRYGHLVAPSDPTALAAAMLQSLHASHERVALKTRAQDFSIDRAVDKYEELFFPLSLDRDEARSQTGRESAFPRRRLRV
jgi:glycosyltransferase involved in cell wall biosynthesis